MVATRLCPHDDDSDGCATYEYASDCNGTSDLLLPERRARRADVGLEVGSMGGKTKDVDGALKTDGVFEDAVNDLMRKKWKVPAGN